MAKQMKAWWDAHKPTRRRLIQVYAALLYNANLKGFLQGKIFTGVTKNFCVPGFNCYSCPGAIGACPLGALQNALASSGNRAPYYVLGMLLLFGLVLGRTICGWLCPLGLIQEWLHKIPTPKLKKNHFTRVLSWLKYVILALFVVYIPLVYSVQHFPVPGFCKYICPAGTFEGAMALLAHPANAAQFSMLNILFTRKFIIMVLIFTACVFAYRAFCRFLCPLGAIYGLFARIALVGVKVEESQCTHCQRCVSRCPMDISRVGDHECIHCGACISVCPTSAIRLSCGRITLMKNEGKQAKQTNETINAPKRRIPWAIVAWALALVLLAGALWYANRPGDEAPLQTQAQTTEAPVEVEPAEIASPAEPEPTSDIPVGFEPGMRCPDFTVPLYGQEGGSFALAPGQVTVINFWATWCTPCVAELPYFQQLYDAYGDNIRLVAIHSNLVTDDVQTFLDREGFAFPFGLDESGSVIQSLGGSTMLPMTVVVDQAGVIIYNKVGSVTYPLLESLVQPLLSAE